MISPAAVMPAAHSARPVAVTVIAVIMLVLNGFGLIQSVIGVIFQSFVGQMGSGTAETPMMVSNVLGLISCPLEIIFAIGLFKLLEWARKGMIYTEIISTVLGSIASVFALAPGMASSASMEAVLSIVVMVFAILFSFGIMAAVIYVLTRPPIVAAFKQQT